MGKPHMVALSQINNVHDIIINLFLLFFKNFVFSKKTVNIILYEPYHLIKIRHYRSKKLKNFIEPAAHVPLVVPPLL